MAAAMPWRCGLVLLTLVLHSQEPPVIPGIQWDAAGRATIRVPSAPDTYSVLFRGDEIPFIETPAALERETPIPEGHWVELTDPESPLQDDARFYRVAWFPIATPGDVDDDGLDDLFEVRWSPDLDPLNSGDALLDPDQDYRSTVEEFRDGTDPFAFNEPT
ncbi:MAG: hypothetical protein J0L84_17970, partial [Verrucomicrobia bacterium]|nr:hypothetical protein [Verrucomicrobiota bacterium]